MNEYKDLWSITLREIEPMVSKSNQSLFKNTAITKLEEGTVHIAVPSLFVKEFLSSKFNKTILKVLRQQSDVIKSVNYTIAELRHEDKKKDIVVVRPKQESTAQLPLNDLYVNKEDNLNPRYTFDSFIIGPFNQLAHAASQAVIQKPGTAYNPLFIYGSTGRGKTHLIQAIGNEMKKLYPGKKIYYMTSEKFANEYFNSLNNGKINQFKQKHRVYDVFIMDDIQFFSNKEKSQEELFHVFNELYDNNKQIIFSSDKHPHFIQNLEDRLKSRFGAGMIVDIPAPDYESRALILKKKISQHNIELTQDIIDFIASTVDGNIREIEGVVNSIVMRNQIDSKPLSLSIIKTIIKGPSRPRRNVSIKDVIKTISQFYDIEEKSIYEKTRKKEVVKPRQVIMYILREDYDVSYPSIGEKLGGRDHTTVIHSCEKVKADIKTDPSLVEEIERIRSIISC